MAVKAHPGAEGFGETSIGGRGGTVLFVDSTSDSGAAGTLRYALTRTYPRIVIVRVSGTITLTSMIQVTSSYLTLAFQTTPGGLQIKGSQNAGIADGIMFYGTGGNPVHDIIVRNARIRSGGPGLHDGGVGMILYGESALVSKVVFDHCSFEWGFDAPIQSYGLTDYVTFQHCLIAEGADNEFRYGSGSSGNKGDHTATPYRVSIHHCLYAVNGSRNPLMQRAGLFDFRNNVIYGWGGNNAGAFGSWQLNFSAQGNLINNIWLPSSESDNPAVNLENGANQTAPYHRLDGTPAQQSAITGLYGTRIYASGNAGPLRPTGTGGTEWDDILQVDTYYNAGMTGPYGAALTANYKHPTPFAVTPVTTHLTSEVLNYVLSNVGARFPTRDAADQAVIDTVANDTGDIFSIGYGGLTPRSGSPIPVGAWPTLSGGAYPTDTNSDGVIDSYAASRGFAPTDNIANTTDPVNGYTYIESYINSLMGGEATPIVDPPPPPPPDPPPPPLPGDTYGAQFQSTGGVQPYTYTLISGALPDGLTLSSDGQVTGTPTEYGTFTFTVQVSDSASPSNTATKSCSITINSPEGFSFDSVFAFEMVDTGLSSATSVVTFAMSTTRLDSADFTNDTWFFEIVASNNESVARDVILVDGTGATKATISVAPNTNLIPTLYRSSSFALTSGSSDYKIKMPATTTIHDVKATSIRMLVGLVGSSKAVSEIPLSIGDYSTTTNAEGSIVGIGSTARFDSTPTDAETLPSHFSIFRYTAANWSTIDEFEVQLIYAVNAIGTFGLVFDLYDLTAAANVTGTHIGALTSTASAPTFMTLTVSASALIDGHEYEWRGSNPGSAVSYLYKSRWQVKLTSLRAAEAYLMVSKATTLLNAVTDEVRFTFGSTLYGTSRTMYVEAVGHVSANPANFRGDLINDGTNVSGTGGTVFSGATISFTATKSRQRSASVALTDARYTWKQVRTSGGDAMQTNIAFILVVVNWS